MSFFAIPRANQAPFMFLDEMEAALDLINVNKIADYVEKEDKQFILITHKAELSSKASAIIGVTKKVSNFFQSFISLIYIRIDFFFSFPRANLARTVVFLLLIYKNIKDKTVTKKIFKILN